MWRWCGRSRAWSQTWQCARQRLALCTSAWADPSCSALQMCMTFHGVLHRRLYLHRPCSFLVLIITCAGNWLCAAGRVIGAYRAGKPGDQRALQTWLWQQQRRGMRRPRTACEASYKCMAHQCCSAHNSRQPLRLQHDALCTWHRHRPSAANDRDQQQSVSSVPFLLRLLRWPPIGRIPIEALL